MDVTLVPLSPSEALRYVRESMAFRADFIQWLINEVEDDLRVNIFRAELNPLTAPTTLSCSIAANGSGTIRLGDSLTGAHPPISANYGSYELRKPNDCALVFISENTAGGTRWNELVGGSILSKRGYSHL